MDKFKFKPGDKASYSDARGHAFNVINSQYGEPFGDEQLIEFGNNLIPSRYREKYTDIQKSKEKSFPILDPAISREEIEDMVSHDKEGEYI